MSGPQFKTEVTGHDLLKAGLKERFTEIMKATGGGLFMEGEETIGEGKRETPVDQGPLINSGHVQLPKYTPTTVTVVLGFGGPAGSGNQGSSNDDDVGYAVYVHENMTAYHRVGKAKFLEDPVKRRQPTMTARLVRRINQRVA